MPPIGTNMQLNTLAQNTKMMPIHQHLYYAHFSARQSSGLNKGDQRQGLHQPSPLIDTTCLKPTLPSFTSLQLVFIDKSMFTFKLKEKNTFIFWLNGSHSAVYRSDRGSQGVFQLKLLHLYLPFKMLALKLIHLYIFLCGYIFLLISLKTFHCVCSFAFYLI